MASKCPSEVNTVQSLETLLHSGSNSLVTDLFRAITHAADFRSSVAAYLFIVMLHLHPGYVIVYRYHFNLYLRADTDCFYKHSTIQKVWTTVFPIL